jgi:hypothetical protein
MFALYTFVFMALIALAVNVFLIGNSILQQRNTVEYVAMAVVKIANDPAVDFSPECKESELALLNCIFARAEVAGRVAVGSSTGSYHLPAGILRVQSRGAGESCCSSNGGGLSACQETEHDIGGDGPSGPTGPSGATSSDDFCWPDYKVVQEAHADVVMGSYGFSQESGKWVFTPAAPGAVKSAVLDPQGALEAVKLRFHLAPTTDSKIIAPLIGILGQGMQLRFSSSAIAYRAPGGGIQLAVDPSLAME